MDNYKEKYEAIVSALGYSTDVDTITLSKAIEAYKRIHHKIKSSNPELIPGPFICGVGLSDSDGLPKSLEICPTYGAAGFAVYKKVTKYSEPEY